MTFYIRKVDEKILNIINSHCRSCFLDKTMPIVTYLGNLGMVWVFVSILLLNSKLYKKEGIMVLFALGLSTLLSEGIIKHFVYQRPRPCAEISQNDLLIRKPFSNSFPSGHTASSFAVAGIFEIMIRQYGIYVIIVALLIAFSRLYLYMHYPSDIFAGILLGLLCSILIIGIYCV